MEGLDRLITAFLVLSTFAAVHERLVEFVRHTCAQMASGAFKATPRAAAWATYLGDGFTRFGWTTILGVTLALGTHANAMSLFRTDADGCADQGEPELQFFCEYGWAAHVLPTDDLHVALRVGGAAVATIALLAWFVSVSRREDEQVSFLHLWAGVMGAGGVTMIGVSLMPFPDFLGCVAMGAAASLGAKFWHDLAYGLEDLRNRVKRVPEDAKAEVSTVLGAYRRDA